MKQIIQSLKNGDTSILDIPFPQLKRGYVLIKTHKTLISAGTEKMLIDFGKASFINKVRQQPDKVRMVLDKIKTEGLLSTLGAVRNKLDTMLPMGYCNVGTVIGLGEGVNDFAIGDRVVSNGPHAEIVNVPKNLCCKVPEWVDDNEAVFTVLGAIALQGVRLSQPTLGEAFVVMGLGLIGLLSVQILKAHGCRVLALDFDAERTKRAADFGAETITLNETVDVLSIAQTFSRNRGVDGVLMTASTKSDEPIHQAASMCRKRGRIVLVGVTGLHLSRVDFYEKELSFQVSCSYGPGRYDKTYEESGLDYPVGYVRWTEQRNLEAFLDLLVNQSVDVSALITHQFDIHEADKAYDLLSNNRDASDEKDRNALGILIDYPHEALELIEQKTITINAILPHKKMDAPVLGVIGAGAYAKQILIPAFKKSDTYLKVIACRDGMSGTLLAKKYGFESVTTDTDIILNDENINTIVIATRHDSHAYYLQKALSANKHVFIEKPLCITQAEIMEIKNAVLNTSNVIMIGFNRRFSPLVQKMKQLLSQTVSQKIMVMTVNALAIPKDHWTQDMKLGGGRVIGEACHFIDLCRYLADSNIVDFKTIRVSPKACDDQISIGLYFENGSYAVIHYLANGHRSFPKERLEIFTEGKILQLNNFKSLKGYGWPGFNAKHLWRQDKGQMQCVQAFIESIKSGMPSPIPLSDILEVSQVAIEIANTP